MSNPQKQKETQIPSSHRSTGTSSKRQATSSRSQSGNVGTSGSVARGENPQISIPLNSDLTLGPRPTLIVPSNLARCLFPEGVVSLELVREFYANIHASDKEVETLKSYVRGVSLNFSISDICTFHHLQPFDPDIFGFPYPPSTNGPSLNSLAHLLLADEGDWPLGLSSLLEQKGLKDAFHVLNHIICDLFQCTSHVSEIDKTRACFMHAITSDLSVDLRPHVVDLDLSDDETPPLDPNVQSSSTAPPLVHLSAASNSRIADAIAALFRHVNLIHSNLVERIGQVHERVDLIVECQAHDIVVIRNTLSALSRRHTEFITEVNDFINSIQRR
ncbi:hypothetical protein Acr_00g0057050 [Actinidia rufa]|uniref:Putative plant transposon protein domain-containing protein n=1 Tax=Actinidia rufa TaxID=165716 RepID=A0A7J0DPD9_9ERIC|nr:hypothetical protein Acr_00g0057050 [Actinidia rufa]